MFSIYFFSKKKYIHHMHQRKHNHNGPHNDNRTYLFDISRHKHENFNFQNYEISSQNLRKIKNNLQFVIVSHHNYTYTCL